MNIEEFIPVLWKVFTIKYRKFPKPRERSACPRTEEIQNTRQIRSERKLPMSYYNQNTEYIEQQQQHVETREK